MKKQITNEKITVLSFVMLFIVMTLVFQSMNSSFLSGQSIINMIKTVSPIAIASLGLTFVIILDYADISFYMTSCFSAMFMAWLIQEGVSPLPAILGGFMVGILWGAVSGLAVGKFKLPDKISTIAIGSIAFGAAYIFSDGTFIYDNFMESGISNLSESVILGIPLPVYIMALLFILAFIVLEYSQLGRKFYAIGFNKKAAFFSGIPVVGIIVLAFVLCGSLASISTMISTAAQGNGNVKIGLNLLMPAFTSTYIGWSVFGKPCAHGTFLGALFTTVMSNGFIVMNVPYYVGDFIIAIVLLFAIFISKVDILAAANKMKKSDGSDDEQPNDNGQNNNKKKEVSNHEERTA